VGGDLGGVPGVGGEEEGAEQGGHRTTRAAAPAEVHQEEGRETQEQRQHHGHEPAQGEVVVVPDADLVEVEEREGQARQDGEQVPRPPLPQGQEHAQQAQQETDGAHEPAEAVEGLRVVGCQE
jgi:hypothetical protein